MWKNTFSNYWNNQIFTILVSFYSIVFSANKQKNEKKKKQTNLLWKNSQVSHVLEPQSFAYASEEAAKRHSSLTRSIRPVLIHLPEFWSGSTRTEFHYRDCFDSLPPLQQISCSSKKEINNPKFQNKPLHLLLRYFHHPNQKHKELWSQLTRGQNSIF